ncbi:hypothetical protein DNFV4_00374 [Nitrospira tepida]|uniref:Uncharacterized protein n=1 Tax=Nitrospira tepida TaxID=2973512 RepID=A0AA86MVU4_9BACT|nr:hypothetical protein [Nitrospira tepida]CAI4029954.1 hypothetical protein DNFV4_00374 [Nitrospira tepida]
MATARTRQADRATPIQPSALRPATIQECVRCGGLLVIDHCTDLMDGTGRLEFTALRCVQCGDVIDPVILRNRVTQGTKQASVPSGLLTDPAGVAFRVSAGRSGQYATAMFS